MHKEERDRDVLLLMLTLVLLGTLSRGMPNEQPPLKWEPTRYRLSRVKLLLQTLNPWTFSQQGIP